MFEEARDGVVQAFDIMEIFEMGDPFMTCARVVPKSKGNVMQAIYWIFFPAVKFSIFHGC